MQAQPAVIAVAVVVMGELGAWGGRGRGATADTEPQEADGEKGRGDEVTVHA